MGHGWSSADPQPPGHWVASGDHPRRPAAAAGPVCGLVAGQPAFGPGGGMSHPLMAVVGALTQIDIKPPWLTKQGFVAGAAAAIAVAGGVVLGIRLRFHKHAPQQLA